MFCKCLFLFIFVRLRVLNALEIKRMICFTCKSPIRDFYRLISNWHLYRLWIKVVVWGPVTRVFIEKFEISISKCINGKQYHAECFLCYFCKTNFVKDYPDKPKIRYKARQNIPINGNWKDPYHPEQGYTDRLMRRLLGPSWSAIHRFFLILVHRSLIQSALKCLTENNVLIAYNLHILMLQSVTQMLKLMVWNDITTMTV